MYLIKWVTVKDGLYFPVANIVIAIILVGKKKQTNVANFDIEGTVTLHLPDTCTLLTAYLLLLLAQFIFIMQEGDNSITAYWWADTSDRAETIS